MTRHLPAAAAIAAVGLLTLAASAPAGIREATLQVAPASVRDRPALKFTIADTSAAPVRVARLSLRRLAGVSVHLPARVLVGEAGAQVVFRDSGPFFLVVHPPEGSTDISVSLTAGNSTPRSVLRTSPCHAVRFVAYLSPVVAGLVDDRSATVTAAAQRAAHLCSSTESGGEHASPRIGPTA